MRRPPESAAVRLGRSRQAGPRHCADSRAPCLRQAQDPGAELQGWGWQEHVLAMGLAGMDRQVGLLDIDIRGPSQPRMMGVEVGAPALIPFSSSRTRRILH